MSTSSDKGAAKKEEVKKGGGDTAAKGLAGIVAGDSKISSVGAGIGLNYRGYNIEELARDSTFEEVFFLLMYETLPQSEKQLEDFMRKIASQRSIPSALALVLE